MIIDSYNNMNYDRVSDSLSKSKLSINPGISELFFCINYFTSKFIITRSSKMFILNVWYFCIKRRHASYGVFHGVNLPRPLIIFLPSPIERSSPLIINICPLFSTFFWNKNPYFLNYWNHLYNHTKLQIS